MYLLKLLKLKMLTAANDQELKEQQKLYFIIDWNSKVQQPLCKSALVSSDKINSTLKYAP